MAGCFVMAGCSSESGGDENVSEVGQALIGDPLSGITAADFTIVKDNWTWIMATLLIRFTGVFVVLLVLWIGLNIATAILLRVLKEEKKAPAAST